MQRQTHIRSCGFTLIELLVVVSIIAVLAGMVLPVIGMVRDTAQRVRCGSQLGQLGLAFVAYASDWEGRYPADQVYGLLDPAISPAWFHRLPSYLEATKGQSPPMRCPAWDKVVAGPIAPYPWKMNQHLAPDANPFARNYHASPERLVGSGSLVLIFDGLTTAGVGPKGHGSWTHVTEERHRGANVLFADCHTRDQRRLQAGETWGTVWRWLP